MMTGIQIDSHILHLVKFASHKNSQLVNLIWCRWGKSTSYINGSVVHIKQEKNKLQEGNVYPNTMQNVENFLVVDF